MAQEEDQTSEIFLSIDQQLNSSMIISNEVSIFRCTFPNCNKSFNRKGNLKRHKLLHQEIRPFSCRECNQSFKLKQHLNRHIKTHSIPRPYKCSFEGCAESFKKKSHLQRHESFIHEHTKPYPCPHCNFSFDWPSRLDKHLSTVHSKLITQVTTK